LYYVRIGYYAMKIIGDKREAKNIALSSFEKLWAKYALFDNIKNIRGFLYMTTRDACYRYLKSQEKKTGVFQEMAYNSDKTRYEKAAEMIEIESEMLKMLLQAVDSVPDNYRKVLKMIYYNKWNIREISTALGIAISAVRVLKKEAILLLRSKFTQQQLIAVWSTYLTMHGHAIHLHLFSIN
jgi:RNA polymerase sigma factor (sigma-70 family)